MADGKSQLMKTETPINQPAQMIEPGSGSSFVASGTMLFQYNLQTEERLKKICKAKSTITAVGLRKDGELVLTADDSGQIACNIVQSHTLLKKFFGLRSAVTVAKFTPDGYSVVGANKAGCVIVWDLPTGQPTQAVRLCKDSVSAVCFLNDDQAVVGSLDGNLYWINVRVPTIEKGISEAKPRQAVGEYKEHVLQIGQKVTALYTREGMIYAVAGDTIFLVSPERKIIGKSQQILKGISSVGFDSEHLYAGCLDGTLRRLSPDLRVQEIVAQMAAPVLSMAVLDNQVFLCGTTQPTVTLLSAKPIQQQISAQQSFKKQLQTARPGKDTLVTFQAPATL